MPSSGGPVGDTYDPKPISAKFHQPRLEAPIPQFVERIPPPIQVIRSSDIIGISNSTDGKEPRAQNKELLVGKQKSIPIKKEPLIFEYQLDSKVQNTSDKKKTCKKRKNSNLGPIGKKRCDVSTQVPIASDRSPQMDLQELHDSTFDFSQLTSPLCESHERWDPLRDLRSDSVNEPQKVNDTLEFLEVFGSPPRHKNLTRARFCKYFDATYTSPNHFNLTNFSSDDSY
jgi:hypothetical protein